MRGRGRRGRKIRACTSQVFLDGSCWDSSAKRKTNSEGREGIRQRVERSARSVVRTESVEWVRGGARREGRKISVCVSVLGFG